MKKYGKGDFKILVYRNKIVFENKSNKIKSLSKLTNKFYKEWEKGLWIGLYLVKKICDILGYKLKINYKDWIFILEILF